MYLYDTKNILLLNKRLFWFSRTVTSLVKTVECFIQTLILKDVCHLVPLYIVCLLVETSGHDEFVY